MAEHRLPDAELAECAEREVKQRRRVYPNLVASGKMTQEFADKQIQMMEAIARDYRRYAARVAAITDLFGGQ
jgi:hypothetical protein